MFGFPRSSLDTHDIRNYKPIKTTWEVQGLSGDRCWRNLGVYVCVADGTAARHLRQGYRTVRVRSAATLGVDPGKWRRINFSRRHR